MLTKFLNRAEESFISLLLVGMVLLVFADVVLRFGFNSGIAWSQEVTLYMQAWFVLFGASYGVKVGAHIGVDSFVKLIPAGIRRLMGALAVSISIAYCVIFMVGAWNYLSKLKKIHIQMEDLEIERWLSESILLIGFALLMLRLVQLLIRIIKGETEGFSHIDEAQESLELIQQEAAPDDNGKNGGNDKGAID